MLIVHLVGSTGGVFATQGVVVLQGFVVGHLLGLVDGVVVQHVGDPLGLVVIGVVLFIVLLLITLILAVTIDVQTFIM